MGWGNPVVGGTVLAIAAIQSPDFSMAGQTGWAIMQNGDAFFFNITADGIITVSGTGASLGRSISIRVSAGNPTLFFFSGKPEEFIAAQESLQVDNIGLPNELLNLFIIGPSVNASHDRAFINLQSAPADASGTAGGNLEYTDTGGTDHALLQWGSGGIFAGNIKDGQNYDIQRRTRFATGQNISSGSNVNVAGLVSTVAAQTYRFRAKIMLECIAAATPVIEFTGPALNSLELDWIMQAVINSNTSPGSSFTFRTVGVLGGITGVAMSATGLWTVYIDGQMSFSAGGTLQVIARTGGSGNYDIIAGSYIDLEPVTV